MNYNIITSERNKSRALARSRAKELQRNKAKKITRVVNKKKEFARTSMVTRFKQRKISA